MLNSSYMFLSHIILKSPSFSSVILGLSIVLNLFVSSLGFNHTLSDRHGFRQTQNAISVYYLLKEGLTINYIIPSLGAPWTIPIEFPIYQFAVAIFSKLTNLNLIYSGRIISIAFFYFILIYLNKILKLINIPLESRRLLIALVVCSPIYLFWSRTFMIESTALFLTIVFLYFAIKFTITPKIYSLLFALIFGSLSVLVKSSTFAQGGFFILLFLSFHKKFYKEKVILKSISIFIVLIIIFLINLFWVKYTDHLKSQNPLAEKFIVSDYMYGWYFGSFMQKFDKGYWDIIVQRIDQEVSVDFPVLALIILLGIIFTKYRLLIVMSLLTFISGPIIFTNVYLAHNYYLYANTLYLQLALGFVLIGLSQINKLKFFVKYFLIPTIFVLLLKNYFQFYYPNQIYDDKQLFNTAQVIKSFTNQQDVLLIYGYDWNPEIPFYAERKAIMDRWNYPLNEPRIQQSIRNTGKENIRAMFSNNLDTNFIDERVNYFNFQKEPVFHNQYGSLYIKK